MKLTAIDTNGFYRISDSDAKRLAQRAGDSSTIRKIDKYGQHIVVGLPEDMHVKFGQTVELLRVKYAKDNYADAPKRGWVYAVYSYHASTHKNG